MPKAQAPLSLRRDRASRETPRQQPAHSTFFSDTAATIRICRLLGNLGRALLIVALGVDAIIVMSALREPGAQLAWWSTVPALAIYTLLAWLVPTYLSRIGLTLVDIKIATRELVDQGGTAQANAASTSS